MHTTAIPILCQHCGRPIGGASVVIGGYSYHPECTHGPGYPTTYQLSATALTEADVRRIVREEIGQALRGYDLRGNFRCG